MERERSPLGLDFTIILDRTDSEETIHGFSMYVLFCQMRKMRHGIFYTPT